MNTTHFKTRTKEIYSKYIIGSRDIRALLIPAILIDLWWSIVLFLNSDLFNTSKAFRILDNVISEGLFGTICLLAGLGAFYSLIKNHWNNLEIFIGLNIFLWFFVSYSFMVYGVFSTGTGTYFAISLLWAIVYLKNRDTHE